MQPEDQRIVPKAPRHTYIRVALTLLLAAAVFGAMFWMGTRTAPSRSVAVLPFMDLSENRANEKFADGLAEELIERLNGIPGLRVPAPASTFFYKNKRV